MVGGIKMQFDFTKMCAVIQVSGTTQMGAGTAY